MLPSANPVDVTPSASVARKVMLCGDVRLSVIAKYGLPDVLPTPLTKAPAARLGSRKVPVALALPSLKVTALAKLGEVLTLPS